ncbi:MAG: LPS export ABC transporter periplasmic protein LptC [Candidatus Solibacter usitatus]|nr:LPS export ABC transporter periplasmic protein LptC [Candidatus Solibacter usitatus]
MLRRGRWLILLAILGIAAAVTSVFLTQSKVLRRSRPQTSAPLPANTSATAEKWEMEMKSGDRAKIVIRAGRYEQIKNPPAFLLEGMEMEIRELNGTRFDLVKSARAQFNQDDAQLYADGDVEITMNLPQDAAQPAGRLMQIRTSGVTLDVRSSRATTERKAHFEFDQGSGECVGAMYDPSTRELMMKSEVSLDWRGKDPKKPPMHLESGMLIYKEAAAEIDLSPSARLSRGGFRLEAGPSVVKLSKGAIDRVEAVKAIGSDHTPIRQVDYSANYLNLFFTEKSEIRRIEASENARLVSSSASGKTTVTANRLDLEFDTGGEDSVLKRALATSKARVESEAAQRPGAQRPGARVLTSENIELIMRAGGKEIEQVATHSPGQVEFLPARKGDKHRWMTGDRLYIYYAAGNAVEKFRSVDVTTRTESEPRDPKKDPKPTIAVTRSKDMQADFDPRTGQMTRLEQWNDFRYEEGARRATAGHAVLDAMRELITLRTGARMWDESGATAGDEIVLEQQTGDMVASGNVTSTRLPDKKPGTEGMLSSSEPLQAKADRMASTEANKKIRYEGRAHLWQSASSLHANTIFIDRAAQQLEATGEVVSQLPDQKPKKAGNVFTIVRAPSLVYSDKTKLAYYTGGATLDRQGLNVKARQLRAWFVSEPRKEGGEETKLDRMFADGTVEILEKSADRTRTGSSEHAEYYLADERIVLNGGKPVVTDSKRGITRGAEITWLAREDTLVVDNTGGGPAVSRVKKKK